MRTFSRLSCGIASPTGFTAPLSVDIVRTRKTICGSRPSVAGVMDATSITARVPAGIDAPFEPTTGSLSVATNLSPTRLLVQTRDPIERDIAVPAAISRVGAGDGT